MTGSRSETPLTKQKKTSPKAELRAAQKVFRNAQYRLQTANENYNYAHARLQRAFEAVERIR